MPIVEEEFQRLKALMAAGKGQERCTPAIVVRQAAADRVANKPQPGKKRKTRFSFETDSPIFYSELNRFKDRVLHHAGNKAIGIELLIRAWRELTPDKIRLQIEEGHLAPPF